MSDCRKSTAPTVEVPPELRARCAASVGGIQCSLREGHDGPHRTPAGDEWADPPADLPEPPECSPPDRDRPAVREIFAVQLRPAERETLERLADNLLELSREGGPAVRAAIDYGSFPDDLRAVALDLRHAERFLRIVGASEGDVLDRAESPAGRSRLAARGAGLRGRAAA
jgi:hypothetical protein